MAVQDFNLLDHEDYHVRKRLATEYGNAGNLRQLISAWLKGHNLLEKTFHDVWTMLDVDTAVGFELDLIGKLVDQKRTLTASNGTAYFGFIGHPLAHGFGDPNDASVGGRFRAPDEPLTGRRVLIDEEYRVFLKAKIIKNFSSGYPHELRRMLKIVLDVDEIKLDNTTDGSGNHANLHGRVGIPRVLTLNERALLGQTDLPMVMLCGQLHFYSYDPDTGVITNVYT